jgi:hypothetical protein
MKKIGRSLLFSTLWYCRAIAGGVAVLLHHALWRGRPDAPPRMARQHGSAKNSKELWCCLLCISWNYKKHTDDIVD